MLFNQIILYFTLFLLLEVFNLKTFKIPSVHYLPLLPS